MTEAPLVPDGPADRLRLRVNAVLLLDAVRHLETMTDVGPGGVGTLLLRTLDAQAGHHAALAVDAILTDAAPASPPAAPTGEPEPHICPGCRRARAMHSPHEFHSCAAREAGRGLLAPAPAPTGELGCPPDTCDIGTCDPYDEQPCGSCCACKGVCGRCAALPARPSPSGETADRVRELLLAALNRFPVVNLSREDGYDDLAELLATTVAPLLGPLAGDRG